MTQIPSKPKEAIFTDEQWQAMHQSGNNLLVSASAGSGKTMVLVNRIIEKINNPEKDVSVDDLLVVTFTNAAAKEMKQKIEDELREQIKIDPQSRMKLVNELTKLGRANISTLHSFCSKVIERYYYLIDFDPVFRMLTDETEISLIKEDVWDELIEDFYEESHPDFIELMEAYAGKRNDDQITEMVFSLYNFSRANLNPKEWLEKLPDLYHLSSNTLSDSEIYQKYFRKQWQEDINYCMNSIKNILDEIGNEEELEPQIEILKGEYTHYQEIAEGLAADDLRGVYELVNGDFEFKTLRAPRKKSISDELKEYHAQITKPQRDEAKSIYQDFTENFALSPKEQVKILQKMEKHVKILSKITQEFAKAYQGYKMEQKLIDFNDLEHLTLDILRSGDADRGSEAAQYYQDKFEEVLVDEYQDINAVQEAILSLVSETDEDEGNYFMVGDVKQSIYGFRLADPELFLSKYKSYENGLEGDRIVLAENFRSRKEILAFTNFIFKQLMDESLGNFAYDKNAELLYGNKNFDKYESTSNYETELLLYEKDEKTKQSEKKFDELNDRLEIHTKTSGEILTVASRIMELIDEGFEIYDKKEEKMRPLEYRDIVLLTPTKKNNLEIQEVFQELDLPTAINETQNFFQTTEVTIIMSLLKIIDNPRQDIPFVAVLRSPIVGLNEVELTYIRLEDQQADFYEAARLYAEADFIDRRNIEVQKKVQDFLDNLDNLREYARRKSVVNLIAIIYQETGFMDYVGGMSGGKQRKANLEALYHRAASYEKTAFKGLYRFIRFIDKMQEKDKDLAEPTSILLEENAIRVMTIHASKGLEFPVVFLMDMSKRFNNRDWVGNYVLDRELGIGLKYKNPEQQVESSTLVDTAIKNIKKKTSYAEEMRILYVALTRAEQKLFLVGSVKSKENAFKKWDKGNESREEVLDTRSRLSTNNFMDWIGLAIARHKIADNDANSLQENQQIRNYPVRFDYRFYSKERITKDLDQSKKEEENKWLDDLKQNKLEVKMSNKVEKAIEKASSLIHYD
ncbi:MAG: helicase-exonuclease AddAB subunit AddA, partial [Atopostipes sp.]|nr:helicase-exonuclease AddAB subunit AddA [Atopostipes sp.]